MARRGFFQMSEVMSKAPISSVPKCGACGLYKACLSPKMAPTGKGRRKILIIAEAPGAEEDKKGMHLVGNSGRYLSDTLRKYGVDIRRDCWLTNALICRPPDNRIPTEKHFEYCQPNLRNTIAELKPEIIIPIGMTAIKSLVSMVWKDHDIGSITRWYGWQIPSQKINAWICPTFHPAYILHAKNPVIGLYFDRHIEAALQLEGVPWPDGIPNYEDQVDVILDANKAAKIIDQMVERGGMAAFDYEATMLKPDSPDFRIVCCSICWKGKKTIAYPWYGKAIEATQRFIQSDIKKIASNIKYEERATRRVFGHGVNNWHHCTMTAAHWADNRKGITGLKFQSFVELGLETYNDAVEPFLRAKHSNAVNRIDQVELNRLLLYCGMDSLLEYIIGVKQRKMGGLDDV